MIRTVDTSDATFSELTNFAKAMKKVPVSCKVHIFNTMHIWSCLNTIFGCCQLTWGGGGGGDWAQRGYWLRQEYLHVVVNIFDWPMLFQDTPGFIVNRLLVPYMAEAVRMAERGECV